MALPRLGDEVGVSVVQIDDENCYILGWWVGATRSPAQVGGEGAKTAVSPSI